VPKIGPWRDELTRLFESNEGKAARDRPVGSGTTRNQSKRPLPTERLRGNASDAVSTTIRERQMLYISTDAGLEQEFNSLHAQREAAAVTFVNFSRA
jgi:hypothetical protein